MNNVIDKIDGFVSNSRIVADEITNDKEIFSRLMELTLSLEPEQLNDDQINQMVSILEDMDFEEEVDEIKAKRSTQKERQYYKQYARKNRIKIKLKREKFKKSAEGKRREVLKKRLAKSNKTPTGRKKVTYHT